MADDGKSKPATQAEVDKYYKLYKETGEKLETIVAKLDKTAAEKVELVGRLKDLEERVPKKPAYVPPPNDDDLTKVYTLDNPPQTQEEWDDLYDASPSYAHDLKNQVTQASSARSSKMKTAAGKVQEKHPDMYKVDGEGKIKRFQVNARGEYIKDNTGAFIDDSTGLPMLDMESEKGKIWMDIATDPNFLQSPNAPIIIMEAMENRLRTKKEQDMADKLDKEKKDKEIAREKKVDAAAVAIGGDNPPVEKEDIKVEYSSEEEKKHVLAAIAAGRYKDEKDYFRATKRGTVVSYGRGGF